MPIKGFLDAVDPWQVRGWAYDPSRPGEVVRVQVLLDDDLRAEGLAELYRADLEQNSVGNGRHAFVVNLDVELKEDEIERVRVQAFSTGSGNVTLGHAEHHQTDEATPSPLRQPIEFTDSYSDTTQRPVFILGAARSGTRAIAQGLLKVGSFAGNGEGHMFNLLAHLVVTLERFYASNGDERSASRDTTIARVPIQFYHENLDATFIDVASRLFPTGRWIDKTPNSDMVHLAPRFKKIWPESRFIFMRRRFFENADSRSRKFPQFDFERNAKEWAQAMEAWLQVRTQLHGAAVEIDQKFLSEQPELVSKRLSQFLSLTDDEEAHLSQALRYDRPELTAPTRKDGLNLSDIGWTDVQRGHFARYCENLLPAFGYSYDASYYLGGLDESGFVYL